MKTSTQTTATEWVILVTIPGEDGNEAECFIATEGFETEAAALDFHFDNLTAYASDWTVEVATKEDAEMCVTEE